MYVYFYVKTRLVWPGKAMYHAMDFSLFNMVKYSKKKWKYRSCRPLRQNTDIAGLARIEQLGIPAPHRYAFRSVHVIHMTFKTFFGKKS